jgi:hypothetical protein
MKSYTLGNKKTARRAAANKTVSSRRKTSSPCAPLSTTTHQAAATERGHSDSRPNRYASLGEITSINRVLGVPKDTEFRHCITQRSNYV